MFNLIHIGDLHLQPGHPERLEALDRIITEATKLSPLGAWLLPGDLNHGRMSIEDRNALADRLVRMATVAPVVVCYGNHDVPEDLDIFERLNTAHRVYVIKTPTVLDLDLPARLGLDLGEGAKLRMAVLPYPTKAGLVANGTGADTTLEAGVHALVDIVRGFAAEFEPAHHLDYPCVLVGHLNVAGALASCGQPQIGKEIDLDPSALALFGDEVYIGFNHIHKQQQIHGAWYPGSVTPMDWGEMEPKGYLTVWYHTHSFPTLDDAIAAKSSWRHTVTFHELGVPPRYHVEGVLPDAGGFEWRVTKGPGGEGVEAPLTWENTDVRLRVRIPASRRGTVDEAPLRAPFAGCRRLELEIVAEPDRGLRAPAVAIAQTTADKLRAWAEANGQPAPTSALDRLGALETSDRAVLLDLVRAETHAAANGDAS